MDSPLRTCAVTYRSLDETAPLIEIVEGLMVQMGHPDNHVFQVKLALEEALVNAIKHGHQGDPTLTATFSYVVDGQRLSFTVTDQGPGFDPQDVPDCTLPENLERPCGRGLMLIRSFMTDVRWNTQGNSITFIFDKSPHLEPALAGT